MCGLLDDMRNLEDPCDCYKKFDALLVHRKCLQAHIAERSRSYKDHNAMKAMFCDTCGKRYRLRTSLEWTTANIFSTNSFHAYFEGLTIFFTTGMMVFSLYLTHTMAKTSEEAKQEKWLVWPMFSVVMVMVFFTFRKIYERWKRQQYQVRIDDIV